MPADAVAMARAKTMPATDSQCGDEKFEGGTFPLRTDQMTYPASTPDSRTRSTLTEGDPQRLHLENVRLAAPMLRVSS